jgi:transcriptional regulator with XRE-family HTH domain
VSSTNQVTKVIGAKIQTARTSQGQTREVVEQICSLRPGSMAEFECGSLRPTPREMALIAKHLDCPLFYFVAEFF